MRSKLLRGAVGLSLAVASPALAARGGVRLEDGSGRVEVYADGSDKGVGILPGEPLGEGSLKTGDKSRARLAVPEGATVELGEKSVVSVAESAVQLSAGKVTVDDPGGKVQVKADTLVVGGAGAKFEVSLGKKNEVTITSDKGQVEISSKDQKGAVAEGKSLTIKGGKLPADAIALLAPKADAKPDAKPEEKPAEKAEEKAPEKKPEEAVAAKVENKPAEKAPEKAEEKAPAPTPAEPPKITVDWPASAIEGEVKIKGQVSGKDVKVTVNGARAKLKSGGKFEAKVELAAGEQAVEVVATAPDGQSSKEQQKVTVAAKPAEEAKPEKAEAKSEGEAKPEGEEKPKKKGGSKPKVQQEASGWE